MERRLNVLAIDDEQIVLDSIGKHLRKEPYELQTVLSAQEGLDVLEKGEVDIVLTDLMMPEMDGLEFVKKMKARQPHIPVIMITGYATISTALQATQLGAFDYIAKPFTRAELRAVVGRAAELVWASDSPDHVRVAEEEPDEIPTAVESMETLRKNGWSRLDDDGLVVLGVEKAFLESLGTIQNVFLPSEGDQLRQGSVYLRVFSSDLRSHTVLSPLSGTVVSVNELVRADPVSTLQDPYGEGWLVRIKPSKFEFEMDQLDL